MKNNMEDVKEKLRRILSDLPHIREITNNGSILNKLAFDPYNCGFYSDLESDGELTLAGVLHHSTTNYQFHCMVNQLEEWLELYPKYFTKKFGKKLAKNFFDYYSEIETYHQLHSHGCDPQIEPVIGLGHKRLDFKISIHSRDFFIEVITLRSSARATSQFIDGYAGFYNPDIGTTREYDTRSRLEIKIEEEIEHHFHNLPNSFHDPVILIANCSYCIFEIGDPDSRLRINQPAYFHGLLCYNISPENCRNYFSDFYVNPRYSLSSLEREFFRELF